MRGGQIIVGHEQKQDKDYFAPGKILVAPGHTYLVNGLLGEGGMARVYDAVERDTGNEVALKVLRRELADGGNIHLRFERESRIPGQIAKLNKKRKARVASKHLLKVTAIGELKDGTPYYAMTRLSGCTLQAQIQGVRSRAKADVGLPLAAALNIAIELLLTLEALHQCGVVHRDIKPANIFLHKAPGEPDTVVLLDYGIAHLMEEGLRAGVAGTAGYIAPEHFKGEIGPPADIFAVGVLLFKMIAGVSPARCLDSSAWPVGGEKRTAPSLAPFGAVPALVDLVARCLSLEPRARPTAADLSEQLLEISLALEPIDVGTAVTEDDPIDRTAAGDSSSTGLSLAQVSPATSPDPDVDDRMNALRVENERRARLGLPQLTMLPNNETTPMLGRPSAYVHAGPTNGRRQLTVPMGYAQKAPALRHPAMRALDHVTVPPTSPPMTLGPVSRPEYAPESLPLSRAKAAPDPLVAHLPDRRLLAEALRRGADDARQTDHAERGSSPSSVAGVARTPAAEPRGLKRFFSAIRARSALRARERSAAETKERAEKVGARAARLEGEKLAKQLAAQERSELELANKQRQVEENRRRRRQAEARGERWSGAGETRSSSTWWRLLVAAVALCLGGLVVVLVRKRAARAEASPMEATSVLAAGSEAPAPATIAATAPVSTVVVAPPAVTGTAPASSSRTGASRARAPSSAAATAGSARAVSAPPVSSSSSNVRPVQTTFQ